MVLNHSKQLEKNKDVKLEEITDEDWLGQSALKKGLEKTKKKHLVLRRTTPK